MNVANSSNVDHSNFRTHEHSVEERKHKTALNFQIENTNYDEIVIDAVEETEAMGLSGGAKLQSPAITSNDNG